MMMLTTSQMTKIMKNKSGNVCFLSPVDKNFKSNLLIYAEYEPNDTENEDNE